MLSDPPLIPPPHTPFPKPPPQLASVGSRPKFSLRAPARFRAAAPTATLEAKPRWASAGKTRPEVPGPDTLERLRVPILHYPASTEEAFPWCAAGLPRKNVEGPIAPGLYLPLSQSFSWTRSHCGIQNCARNRGIAPLIVTGEAQDVVILKENTGRGGEGCPCPQSHFSDSRDEDPRPTSWPEQHLLCLKRRRAELPLPSLVLFLSSTTTNLPVAPSFAPPPE